MKNLKKILSIGLLLAISQLSIYSVKHLPRRLKLFRGYLNFITILLTLILFNGVVNCFAQNIGINQPNPDNSALLDMTSTERGLLIPRVTLDDAITAAPVTAPAEGLLIYNETGTEPHGFYFWDGSVWKMVGSNGYNTGMGWDNGSNTVSVTDGGGTKSVVLTGFLESEVDASITNELITAFSWTDATDLLRITEAGTNWDVTIDNEADDVTLTDVQNACTNDFHNIGGTDAVNDADNNATNELQNLFNRVQNNGGANTYTVSSQTDILRFNNGTNTTSGVFQTGNRVDVSFNVTGLDNYNNWKLQANGGATTNITSGATVNFAQSGATIVSRLGNKITISSQQNTQAQNGYVLAGGTNYNKVWKTDGSGNPAWRDDAGAGTCSHYIGESYGGGKIFILDYSGCHGLISATDNQSTSAKWNIANSPLVGTLSGMMTGAHNTTAIDDSCTTAGIAADICQNLSLNSYTDWFLPSKDEIYEMYLIKDVIGNFADQIFWSSTEVDIAKAWTQNFSTGAQSSNTNKTSNLDVRCIRHF